MDEIMGDLYLKRILVAGGAGFLGSHLCERLLAKGHEVICLDNFSTGTRSNIAHLMDDPRFEVIRHDITEPLVVHADEIYNLACPASPIHYQADPIHTTKTSVLGAINLLGLARLQACVAHEVGVPTGSLVVHSTYAYLDLTKGRGPLKRLTTALRALLPKEPHELAD